MGFGVQKVSQPLRWIPARRSSSVRVEWSGDSIKPMELGRVSTPICKQMHQKEEQDQQKKSKHFQKDVNF